MQQLLIQSRSVLSAANWQEIGSCLLGADLILFAALACVWEKAAQWRLPFTKRAASGKIKKL